MAGAQGRGGAGAWPWSAGGGVSDTLVSVADTLASVADTLAVPGAGAAECEGRAGPRTPAPAPATDCTLHCTGCRASLHNNNNQHYLALSSTT